MEKAGGEGRQPRGGKGGTGRPGGGRELEERKGMWAWRIPNELF